MVGKTVLKYGHDSVTFQPTMVNNSISHTDEIWTLEQPLYTPMQVVSSLCIVVGSIQVSLKFKNTFTSKFSKFILLLKDI